jgi:hypothetical protein
VTLNVPDQRHKLPISPLANLVSNQVPLILITGIRSYNTHYQSSPFYIQTFLTVSDLRLSRYEIGDHPECDAVLSGRWIPVFVRNMLPLSSWWNSGADRDD